MARGRGFRMAGLPPAFIQRVLVFVAQGSSGREPCRNDAAGVRFGRSLGSLLWRLGVVASDTGQRGECVVDRIQLVRELFPFRLQQTHRVVQINHASS